MNTYSKYVPNVFLAKCTEQHEKGSVISVTTRNGKNNDCVVFNLVYSRDGFYYYSIVRADGFNYQEWAKRRAGRRMSWANSAEIKSDQYYTASNKDRAFLSLGEPIKIGHHSQDRHEKLYEQANNNMRKCVEFSELAEKHESVAEYWEEKAKDINLSMPESVDYFTFMLEKATQRHEGLKAGTIERGHSMSLQYAKKEVNEIKKKVDLAKKLWL